MTRTDKYPYAKSVRTLCALLKIQPERVLRRAGLPADALDHEGRGATAAQLFAIWEAACAEAQDPDLPLNLGKISARGPFNSAVFAFSCSPTIEIGLTRLAVFKPLVGPFELRSERRGGALEVTIRSIDNNVPMPASLAAYEVVFFVEIARIYSAETIVPVKVGVPEYQGNRDALEKFLGTTIVPAPCATIILSPEDAERRLITENDEMWAGFEKNLRRRLDERGRGTPISTRVKNALLEMLPGGQSSAEAVCQRLHISKRSLYRHLRNEGHTYQELLDATRTELSMRYLAKSDISIDEISYLLAFRDPNSFYRAFRNWTGMTPREARGQRAH